MASETIRIADVPAPSIYPYCHLPADDRRCLAATDLHQEVLSLVGMWPAAERRDILLSLATMVLVSIGEPPEDADAARPGPAEREE